MTNTEAQAVLGNMLMRHNLTDAELTAIGMAGEALEEEKWFSVNYRLPEVHQDVIIYESKIGVGCGYYHVENGEIRWHREAQNDFCPPIKVTHWRHLPKGPEVD